MALEHERGVVAAEPKRGLEQPHQLVWKGYPLAPGQVGTPEARARCGCTLASLSESAATPAGAGGGPTWPNHLRNCGLSETTILTNLSPYASLTLVLRAAPSANDRYARSIRTMPGASLEVIRWVNLEAETGSA